MDFRAVIDNLSGQFKKSKVRYALIGGFALGVWGINRSTVDIDILVDRDDMEKVDKIMTSLGYKCQYHTENVTQYVSPLKVFGEIDFLHAFRKASLKMLDRAENKKIFDGVIAIKVLKPEDIIGLKIQAMANNPSRKTSELADIEALIEAHKDKLNWKIIKKYFTIFDMQEAANKLKDKYYADK